MSSIITTGLAFALFAALLVMLGGKPRLTTKLIGVAMLIAVVTGIVIYGNTYFELYVLQGTVDLPLPLRLLLALLRTVLTVGLMFTGRDYAADVMTTALYARHPWILYVLWVGQFCSFYATASSAVTLVGKRYLKHIRMRLLRRGELRIIFGANEDSLLLGRRMADSAGVSVVFIDAQCEPALRESIAAMGSVLRSDLGALHPDAGFMSSIGLKKRSTRRVHIYALHKDIEKNCAYAREFLSAAQALELPPELLHLTLLSYSEEMGAQYLHAQGQYGYGNVMAFDESEMVARLMVHRYPPCCTISFDERGCAEDDFSALMIGFGKCAQAALQQLIRNGQFEGSRLHVDIFAKDSNCVNGYLYARLRTLTEQYDIRFHDCDARSAQMYSYLNSYGERLKYIVIATGNEKLNQEIARELEQWFEMKRCRPLMVLSTGHGFAARRAGDPGTDRVSLYDSTILWDGALDAMAMVLNHRWSSRKDWTPEQSWRACDYFGRMSSRAAADYYPAFLCAAGVTAEQAMNGEWKPQGELLETLGRMEHSRWCAFMYSMGIVRMPEEHLEERALLAREELQRMGAVKLRVTRDDVRREHACLIPWEELDALSRWETDVTGVRKDYKQNDLDNVLAVPDILLAERQRRRWGCDQR